MGQLQITGVSEREERNKWFESLFEEIVAETCKSEEGNGHTNSKWSKTPTKIKPKRLSLRDILKLSKITASENLKNNERKARTPVR